MQKRLAIMFTDLADSTRFFSKYGDAAGKTAIETHNMMIAPIIKKCSGRMIKNTGDGALIVFNRALDSMVAANRILNAFDDYNDGKKPHARIGIKIGLDYGEVIDEGADVHGLHVSIASRLASAASQGQAIVSDEAYRDAVDDGFVTCSGPFSISVKGVEDSVGIHTIGCEPEPNEPYGRVFAVFLLAFGFYMAFRFITFFLEN